MDSCPDPPHLQDTNGHWHERKVLIRWLGWAKHSLGHHSRCCVWKGSDYPIAPLVVSGESWERWRKPRPASRTGLARVWMVVRIPVAKPMRRKRTVNATFTSTGDASLVCGSLDQDYHALVNCMPVAYDSLGYVLVVHAVLCVSKRGSPGLAPTLFRFSS